MQAFSNDSFDMQENDEEIAQYSARFEIVTHDENDVHVRIYVFRTTDNDDDVAVCEIHAHDFDAAKISTHRQMQELYNDVVETLSSDASSHDFSRDELTFNLFVLSHRDALRELLRTSTSFENHEDVIDDLKN